jgi:hemerythrin-like domain-containing protein
MDPVARLVEEHETILAVAELARRQAVAIQRGEPVKAAKVGQILDFIRTFADAYHHGKEENLLFVRMEQRGFSRQVGPLAVMLVEHEQGRQFVRQAAAALDAAAAGNAEACGAVAAGLSGWAELIQGHIEKENHVLYPMAQGVLSQEEFRLLGEEFERFEAGHPEGTAWRSWVLSGELAAE